METKIWLYSQEQFTLACKAREGKSEIDICGLKYLVTSCLWNPVRGGYYTIKPLLPDYLAGSEAGTKHEMTRPGS
jgi:hypothetical protein